MGTIHNHARAADGAAAREALILKLQPVVERTARYMSRKIDWVAVEDLRSTGQLGLLAAVDTYSPAKSKGLSLEVWAMYKVRGAMLDSVRRRNYEWAKHEHISNSGAVMTKGLAAHLMADWGEPDNAGFRPLTPDANRIDHDSNLLAGQRQSILRNMIQRLPPDERVAVRTYLNGKTLPQAGEQIRVNGYRCWALRQAGLKKLRERLAKRGLGPRELLEG